MRLNSKLERDLFDLAEMLGVGSKNSDTCLRAIAKIQELESDVSTTNWRKNGDGMGGSGIWHRTDEWGNSL